MCRPRPDKFRISKIVSSSRFGGVRGSRPLGDTPVVRTPIGVDWDVDESLGETRRLISCGVDEDSREMSVL